MAQQFFQILSPENKPRTMEELRQYYPNVSNVQYVISTQDDQQQQFQTQQVLETTDQVMVVEKAPQQVVTQVTYQAQPQFILQQTTTTNNFQEQGQQVYFVEPVEATSPETKTVVAQAQPVSAQPQPVVLNHHLTNTFKPGQKFISPVYRQLQQGQLQQQTTQQAQAERPAVGTPQRQIQLPQARPSIHSTPQSRQQVVHTIQLDADSQEARALPDGSIVTLSTYKKLQSQVQQLATNVNSTTPNPRRRNVSKPTSRPRAKVSKIVAPLIKKNPNGTEAQILTHTPVIMNQGAQRPRFTPAKAAMRTAGMTPTRFQGPQAVLQQRGVAPPPRLQQPQVVKQGSLQEIRAQVQLGVRQQVPQNQQQIRAQLQMQPQQLQQQLLLQQRQLQLQSQQQQPQQVQPQQLQPQPQLQPYRVIVPSSQLQRIIESTPQTEEYTDSIRMLVLLSDGEQRLITFTLPKEQCTIQEILEQVGVKFTADTKIDCRETRIAGINYVVTVGLPANTVLEESNPIEELLDTEEPVYSGTPQATPEPEPVSPPKPSTPEPPKEVPKLIPGRLAVCKSCGYLSEDFNRCLRCKRKLPENVRSVETIDSAALKKQETAKVMQALQEKKQINITLKANSGIAKALAANAANANKKKGKSKAPEPEPVIVTLSSDDEDEEEQPPKVVTTSTEELVRKLQENSVTLIAASNKEPSLKDIQQDSKTDASEEDKISENDLPPLVRMEIFCRTIRIGSYRYIPKENLIINTNSLELKVPHPKDEKTIKTIVIDRTHIVKVLVSFSKMLPVIFYYVKPSVGEYIREQLGMKSPEDCYFDPLSNDEPFKRITILPEYITEEIKEAFKEIYSKPHNIMDELNSKEANNILILTCPKELCKVMPQSNCTEIKQLLIYPPGKGGISINTEDYLCLGADQFLNDVIIDFYLKYVVLNMLPPEQQEKVHIFSTFFYKRLTTKPQKATRKSHPAELDPALTPAQKRHSRVTKWTKNINLFEKDFIIIPINENCHWFLAIVCFPGMNGCFTMDGKPTKIEPKTQKAKVKKVATTPPVIGNVTITTVKVEKKENSILCEDGEASDKDEAEGDDSELDSEEEPEEPMVGAEDQTEQQEQQIEETEKKVLVTGQQRQPIKQPCILIFDSLSGTSRSRVVATLRDYLSCEYKVKTGIDKKFDKDVIKGACPKVPQQNNFTDCGVYLLEYVESFFMNPIKDYHIPISELKNWFEAITVTKKREDIALLIKELMMQYNRDINMLPEIILPTNGGKLAMQYEDEEFDEDEEEMLDEEEELGEAGELETMEEETDDISSSMQEMPTDDEKSVEASDESNSSPIKPSMRQCRSFVVEQDLNDSVKPDLSESPKLSSRETMSYLKSKRIIRHKQLEQDSEVKKLKLSE